MDTRRASAAGCWSDDHSEVLILGPRSSHGSSVEHVKVSAGHDHH